MKKLIFTFIVILVLLLVLSTSVAHAETNKVWICHNGNSINVASEGWNGHDRHVEDFLISGEFDPLCNKIQNTATSISSTEIIPTEEITLAATEWVTSIPTEEATPIFTEESTIIPTEQPTAIPTEEATAISTMIPTIGETNTPATIPTKKPTAKPKIIPLTIPVTGNCPVWMDVTLEQPFTKDLVLIQLKNNTVVLGYYDYTKQKWYYPYGVEIKNADMWYQYPDPPIN